MDNEAKYYWIEEKNDQGIAIEISTDLNLKVDPMALGMLQNNQFNYLLPTRMEFNNGKVSFHYFSASSLRLESKKTAWDKSSFLNFLKNLKNLIQEMNQYLLNPHSLALEAGLLFFEGKKLRAIALPYECSQKGPLDLGPFLKATIISSYFDGESDSYLVQLLNQINQSGPFDLKKLEIYIQSEEENLLSEKTLEQKKPEEKSTENQFLEKYEKESSIRVPKEKEEKLLGVSLEVEEADQKELTGEDNPFDPSSLIEIDEPGVFKNKSTLDKRTKKKRRKEKNSKVIKETSSELEESSISFFYLMQHFSKKNLDLYREGKKS